MLLDKIELYLDQEFEAIFISKLETSKILKHFANGDKLSRIKVVKCFDLAQLNEIIAKLSHSKDAKFILVLDLVFVENCIALNSRFEAEFNKSVVLLRQLECGAPWLSVFWTNISSLSSANFRKYLDFYL